MKTARDAFLSLTTFVLLYTLVGTFLSVAFTLIEYAYPPIGAYMYGHPSVSFGLATLIVVTPILLGLLVLAQRFVAKHPERIYTRTRKFFTYLTLFFSGATIIADFITVVYYFLDGQDFSTAFVLKCIVVLLTAGAVLWYYIGDLAEKTTKTHRMIAGGLLVAFVLLEIIASFAVIGTPASQRAARYDDQRVQGLEQVQSEVLSYWQNKNVLPVKLSDIEASLLGNTLPVDPQTGAPYQYKATGALTFQLCSTFGAATDKNVVTPYYGGGPQESWDHAAGRVCFDRTIDPAYYGKPTTKTPLTY